MTARLRTGYSFRTAVGEIDDVLAVVKQAGWTTAPITDRGNTFGFIRWRKACAKADIRPIYGVELAVSPSPEEKKPRIDHWIFLAIDSIRPLNELVSVATRQFRFEPILTYAQALEANGLIKIIGRRSDISLLPLDNQDNTLFVAASPSANASYLADMAGRGIRPIACGDNMYPTASDEGFYQVLVGRGASMQTYPQYIMDDPEWKTEMQWRGYPVAACNAALANRLAAFKLCTATLPRSTLLQPAKPRTMRAMCIAGATRLNINLNDPVYAARLDRELAVIEEKNFEDYFYVVADMVNWARARMTVGPARGSSAGSLVCYLLGITLIDPIPYGLLFERFISLDRPDMPDIDCDFSDEKRDLIFQYLADTYGKDRMARLGTVSKYGAASALNEAAGALRVPPWEAKPVLEAIVKRSSGDARKLEALTEALTESDAGKALITKHPSMIVAARLESHPRHGGMHACGIVLTDKPVMEYVTIDARTGATQCDKKDAEDLDLLKIDCLGLTQLSVFEDALSMAGLPHDFLDTVTFDDPQAFAILNERKFAGIFQFVGPALKALARQVTVDCLDDLSAISALARPGTLQNGAAGVWAKRRAGKEPVVFAHETYRDITVGTYGIILYQEQVMQIGRNIGKLTWEEVSAIRRSMSKSLGKNFFDQFGVNWKRGAIESGLPASILDKLWDDLCSYGAMSFNKCLAGSTLVRVARVGHGQPKFMSIEDLYHKYVELPPTIDIRKNIAKGFTGPSVFTFDGVRGLPTYAVTVHKNGLRNCFRYTFDDGTNVVCTNEHQFIINNEMTPIGQAVVGSSFIGLKYDDRVPYNKFLIKIEHVGMVETYDIEMPDPHHNFMLGNDLVTHNSHSVAYGMVSYWCLWLKAHYPLEFCAATLQHEVDPAKQIAFLREISEEGIGYVPVSAEHSTDKWHVANFAGVRKLVGPVGNVVGFGPKLVSQFVSAKARNEPMPDRVRKLLTNPVTPLDSLWPIRDAFQRLMPNPHDRNIFTPPTTIAHLLEGNGRQDVLVFCVFAKLNQRDENELINVLKRGGKKYTDGLYTSLNIQILDDTGMMLGRIDRFSFTKLGKDIVDRGLLNNALYAVKGQTWGDSDFRGLSISAVRFIGLMREPRVKKEIAA